MLASDSPLDTTLRSGSALPKRCAKCGARSELERRSHVFTWTPRWALPLIWVPFTSRIWARRAPIAFFLCPVCAKRWSDGSAVQIAALALVALPFGASHLLAQPALFFALFPLAAAGALYITRSSARARQLYATFIDFDRDHVTLGGLHPDVVAALKRCTSSRRSRRTPSPD